jgi:hypothetical protein
MIISEFAFRFIGAFCLLLVVAYLNLRAWLFFCWCCYDRGYAVIVMAFYLAYMRWILYTVKRKNSKP